MRLSIATEGAAAAPVPEPSKKSPARTKQPPAAPAQVLLIRDPNQLTVSAESGQAEFACGVQRAPRRIEVQHNAKPDAKLGTAGDILVVKFP